MGCTISRYSRTCCGSSPSTSVSPVAAAELPNPNLDVTLAPINGDARPLRPDEIAQGYACYDTQDYRTGRAAFLNKTKPNFEGH